MRNTIQVIGLCMANLCLMIYGTTLPKEIQDAIDKLNDPEDAAALGQQLVPIEIVIPCILFGGTIIMSYIASKLYNEFSWSIYKHISADLRMKQRYLTYQVVFRPPLCLRYRLTAIRSTLR